MRPQQSRRAERPAPAEHVDEEDSGEPGDDADRGPDHQSGVAVEIHPLIVDTDTAGEEEYQEKRERSDEEAVAENFGSRLVAFPAVADISDEFVVGQHCVSSPACERWKTV